MSMSTKKHAKHTWGPWELEKRECQSLGSIHYAIKTSYKRGEHPWGPRFIAWMCGSLGEIVPHRKPDDYRDDPSVEADARLIAAAPELLEALERAIHHMIAEYNSMGGEEEAKINPSLVGLSRLIDRCEAAIRKARGES